ncbi:MAG TPA: hypothetical protein DEB06_07335 [Phycisphaerales bacterium]|nr:hypothetical protein [Phycisphaerales bacterium]
MAKAKATKQQFGMQMSRAARPVPNVYAGLMLGAVVCLAAAVGFMALAAKEVGPGGAWAGALKLHPKSGRVDIGR